MSEVEAMMLATLWSFLMVHPYLALVPLVLLEGPLATILAGSLVAAGALAWPAALVLVVAADLTADCVYFLLGRAGRRSWALRALRHLGLDEHRQQSLGAALASHLPMVLTGAKIADAAAVPTMLAAGFSGVRIHRFLAWDGAITAVKSVVLLAAGALFAAQVVPLVTPATSVALLAAVVGSALLARTLVRRKVLA